jgi:hypothetical protein
VATYDYTDEKGEFQFQVVRYEPKAFLQRRRVVKANGAAASIDWENNVKGTRRLLYHLPEVLAADEVILVKGEKDADRLRGLGFVATCNPGGACTSPAKWLKNYTDSLEGKRVAIFPDNDVPGRKHAEVVAQAIRHRVKDLKIVPVPVGKDMSDWIDAGATAESVRAALENALCYGEDEARGASRAPVSLGVQGDPSSVLPKIQVNERPFRNTCADAINATGPSKGGAHAKKRALDARPDAGELTIQRSKTDPEAGRPAGRYSARKHG